MKSGDSATRRLGDSATRRRAGKEPASNCFALGDYGLLVEHRSKIRRQVDDKRLGRTVW